MNKQEDIGVIEAKEEAIKSSDNTQYWKFKITLEGAEKPLTFSCWDYEAGTKVKKGEKVKFYYTEKPGTGFEGKPITYRNIQSIGTLDKYKRDPDLGSDSQLVRDAPSESMKDIVHKESVGGSGGLPTYNQGARIGMLFNQACENARFEKNLEAKNIRFNFDKLKKILEELE